MFNFVVICRDDKVRKRGRLVKGPYVLATRRTFAVREDADAYAKTVNPARQPMVVEGRWHQLRT